jgi:hypothetical protein
MPILAPETIAREFSLHVTPDQKLPWLINGSAFSRTYWTTDGVMRMIKVIQNQMG